MWQVLSTRAMAATYHVSTRVFEGPFDLLLHLIARRKVDVYDVPLAEITDDYLAVLRSMETLDLDVTTEFLVVAATLIELKAARLLPSEDDPEIDELAVEARDLLYARLLEYRTFHEAAAFLRERLQAHQGYVPRHVVLEAAFAALRPDVELPLDAAGLARLAGRVFADAAPVPVDLTHVQPPRMSVRDACSLVLEDLARAAAPLTFAELTRDCRTRAEVVVHFLALLELYKVDLLDLEQQQTFGDMTVTWTPERGHGLDAAALTVDGDEP